MQKINLDALVQREDFEIQDSTGTHKKKDTISIEDLKHDAFFYLGIRKPDFQRETNEWDGSKICEFIESFLDGDLIPAIILWRSPSSYVFVIDGSHRLSSLAAWINDDYGDGDISREFYAGNIPEEQKESANRTRLLVNKKIGSYKDFKLAATNPDKVMPAIVPRAKNLAAVAISLQWVEGNAKKAEQSFFKINSMAAPINKTELALLESRNKPNCIAARAIIRSGTGHKYWDNFHDVKQEEVREVAAEINKILFEPPLKTPVKTLDIPIGGKLYSSQTLRLILEFVNTVNNITSNFKSTLSDDLTGDETIRYLKRAREIAWRINSQHTSSLGLHPVVYFYSNEGRHKVASFYATVALIIDLEKRRSFADFIEVRSSFEELLLKYDYVIQQIVRKHRGAEASYMHIKEFYVALIVSLKSKKTIDNIIEEIVATKEYNYLSILQAKDSTTSSDFSTAGKSAVFIRDTISNAPRCKICGGYIHRNSITIDHKTRKREGGTGDVDNGQLAHPYCNSAIKH